MRNKTLIQAIDELILDDGYISYSRLSDDSKEMLTALCIRDLGKSGYEVLVECNDCDANVSDLIGHLLSGTNDSAQRLADTLKDNAVMYFENKLMELYDERYGVLEADRMREAGLHPIVDRVNGEVRWIR